MRPVWLLLAALFVLAPAAARAEVQRFAVIVGNDRGAASQPELLYAKSDAARVHDVLREIGGFRPENVVLLRGESAETVRRTMIAVNDRIRAAVSEPDTQAVLFVYYSGHADADALQLGATRLAMTELAQLVRGSAASFRLLVLDACRSGALTRLKGGRIRAPFALPDERLPGDGLAFLTASTATEDAQESDELRGSFFTHAFVSGLLGAGDRNADGAVSLQEVYRYAYEATLRSTSRTLAGTQHPTFRYDFRGHGDLVLTRPEAYATQRATLRFPEGASFLVMREDAHGAVVGEVEERASVRALSLRPGRYFVRARAPDVMFEGVVLASVGRELAVDTAQLERIEYARLVRKGLGEQRSAQLLEGGARVRSTLPNADIPCMGGFVGYGIDFASLGLRGRLSACRAGFDNAFVRAATDAYDLELRAQRAWDLPAISLELGIGGGLGIFRQAFETRGAAPDRTSAAPFLALGATATLEVTSRWYLSLDLTAETHFLSITERASEGPRTQVAFAARTSLGMGARL